MLLPRWRLRRRAGRVHGHRRPDRGPVRPAWLVFDYFTQLFVLFAFGGAVGRSSPTWPCAQSGKSRLSPVLAVLEDTATIGICCAASL